MPVFEERSWAAEIASSLMSTPVTAAPSRARLKESPPELHCRWASVFPERSPSSARSSGKRVLPPSRRNLARSPRWLSCVPTTAFQERRFCSRRSLWSTGGFYNGAGYIPIWLRRLVTMLPALVVLAIGLNPLDDRRRSQDGKLRGPQDPHIQWYRRSGSNR